MIACGLSQFVLTCRKDLFELAAMINIWNVGLMNGGKSNPPFCGKDINFFIFVVYRNRTPG